MALLKKIDFKNNSELPPEEDQPLVADQGSSPSTSKKFKFNLKLSKFSKKKLLLFSPLIIIIFLILIVGLPAFSIYSQAKGLMPLGQEIADSLKAQDFATAKDKLDRLEGRVRRMNTTYKLFFWLKPLPVVGNYVKDGQAVMDVAVEGSQAGVILIEAIDPYLDLLGLRGEGTFEGGTVEQRILLALDTMHKIAPELDKANEHLVVADQRLTTIDPARYPKYQAQISQGKQILHQITDGLTRARPMLDILSQMAGNDRPVKYMVLFHNDGELRATGGFMTAYGILEVNRGVVTSSHSSDIYDLDRKFNSRLKPPEPIEKYLKNVPVWHLRDMNLSPDFKINMDIFSQYYLEIPTEPEIDGIITVDTDVLVDIVDVLGPIEVPGYGNFSTDPEPLCGNCPQIVYQLELIADRPVATLRENRKGVLGPMMSGILLKMYQTEPDQWPNLLQAIFKNIDQKHILFYLLDEPQQQAVETARIAGRVDTDFEGDYLLINDTNFSGAKANFFVTQHVEEEITYQNGKVQKTLNITYKNPQPGSNCNLEAGELCLNASLPNWVRVYVPKGAKLVESLGFEQDPEVKESEEFNKTYFEGFLTIYPENQAKIVFTYEFDYQPVGEYQYLVQKQPGKDEPEHAVTFNQTGYEEFFLLSDQNLYFPLK